MKFVMMMVILIIMVATKKMAYDGKCVFKLTLVELPRPLMDPRWKMTS